jgi:hypothetical protein
MGSIRAALASDRRAKEQLPSDLSNLNWSVSVAVAEEFYVKWVMLWASDLYAIRINNKLRINFKSNFQFIYFLENREANTLAKIMRATFVALSGRPLVAFL